MSKEYISFLKRKLYKDKDTYNFNEDSDITEFLNNRPFQDFLDNIFHNIEEYYPIISMEDFDEFLNFISYIDNYTKGSTIISILDSELKGKLLLEVYYNCDQSSKDIADILKSPNLVIKHYLLELYFTYNEEDLEKRISFWYIKIFIQQYYMLSNM